MVEVQIRFGCSFCDGQGIVQNPCWAEFWDQPNAKELTNEEVEKWFLDRGLMHWSKPIMGRQVLLFPEEEVPCDECEGSKVLYRWVPVASIMPGQQTADGMGVLI